MKITGRSLELLLFLMPRRNQEFSGYDISKKLGVSSGTLYPLLVSLAQKGLVEDRWELGDPKELGRPRRRYYRITGLGAQAVETKMRLLGSEYQPRKGSGGNYKPAWG